MKAAILHGPRDFRVEDVSDPELDPDGIVLRVKAFGICGSELPLYERGLPDDRVQERGVQAVSMAMTGHEFSGEVAEVGANVTGVKPGDRVAAGGYYGFSEYRSIPASRLLRLPDDMSYEVGVTIEPIGIGVGLATKAEPSLGDTVAVLGAGMIGQGTWQVLKAMGASRIIVTDTTEKRLEIARALALKPIFVVCDNPVAHLDVSIQAQVINLLMKLREERSLTYLFIAHDLALVRNVSDRVAVMYAAKIVESAGCDELFENPLNPYTQALLAAVPIPDPKVERERKVIILPGELPSPINPPSGCRFHPRCDRAIDICQEQEPELRDTGGEHRVACHLV